MEEIEILYEDDFFVAVRKPVGILIHLTKMSEDKISLMQVLRNQLGYRVYTVHRLDRATSGIVLFGKNQSAANELSALFRNQAIEKKYLAILRGWVPDKGTIDYELSDAETGKLVPQQAVTHFLCLGKSEINAAIGLRYPTARFSFVLITPTTGRRHQIRKHFAHLRHPIIGDKRHGDVKQNKYFNEKFSLSRMFLHALKLSFLHPFSGKKLEIQCPPDEQFLEGIKISGLGEYIPEQ